MMTDPALSVDQGTLSRASLLSNEAWSRGEKWVYLSNFSLANFSAKPAALVSLIVLNRGSTDICGMSIAISSEIDGKPWIRGYPLWYPPSVRLKSGESMLSIARLPRTALAFYPEALIQYSRSWQLKTWECR